MDIIPTLNTIKDLLFLVFLRIKDTERHRTSVDIFTNIIVSDPIKTQHLDIYNLYKHGLSTRLSIGDFSLVDSKSPLYPNFDKDLKEFSSILESRIQKLINPMQNNEELYWINDSIEKIKNILRQIDTPPEITAKTVKPISENLAMNLSRTEFMQKYHVDPLSGQMNPNLTHVFKKIYNRYTLLEEETQTKLTTDEVKELSELYFIGIYRNIIELRIELFKNYINHMLKSNELQLWRVVSSRGYKPSKMIKQNLQSSASIIDQLELDYIFDKNFSTIDIDFKIKGKSADEFILIPVSKTNQNQIFNSHVITLDSEDRLYTEYISTLFQSRNLLWSLTSQYSSKAIFEYNNYENIYQKYTSSLYFVSLYYEFVNSLLLKLSHDTRIFIKSLQDNNDGKEKLETKEFRQILKTENIIKQMFNTWYSKIFNINQFKSFDSISLVRKRHIYLNLTERYSLKLIAFLKTFKNPMYLKERDRMAREKGYLDARELFHQFLIDFSHDIPKRLSTDKEIEQRKNVSSTYKVKSRDVEFKSRRSMSIFSPASFSDSFSSFEGIDSFGQEMYIDNKKDTSNNKNQSVKEVFAGITFKNNNQGEYLRIGTVKNTNQFIAVDNDVIAEFNTVNGVEVHQVKAKVNNEGWMSLPTLIGKDLLSIEVRQNGKSTRLPLKDYQVFYHPDEMVYFLNIGKSEANKEFSVTVKFSHAKSLSKGFDLKTLSLKTDILKNEVLPALIELGEDKLSLALKKISKPRLLIEDFVGLVGFHTKYAKTERDMPSLKIEFDGAGLSRQKPYIQNGQFTGQCVQSSYFLNDLLSLYLKFSQDFTVEKPLTVYSVLPNQKKWYSNDRIYHQVSTIRYKNQRVVLDATGSGESDFLYNFRKTISKVSSTNKAGTKISEALSRAYSKLSALFKNKRSDTEKNSDTATDSEREGKGSLKDNSQKESKKKSTIKPIAGV